MKKILLLTSICLAATLVLVSCQVAPEPPETTAKAEIVESSKVQSATPVATSEVTPVATPEVTPVATPVVTPEVTPVATPVATPEVTPEVTPVATPEVTPVATPEVTPVVTPVVTSVATSEVTPETSAPETGHTVEIYNQSLFYDIVDAYKTKYPHLINENDPIEYYSIEYYGRYGDAHAMFINAPGVEYPDAEWSETVGSQVFNYPDGQYLEVYYNGNLYRLDEAYALSLLTDDSLAALNERFTARAVNEINAYYNLSDELADNIKALHISEISFEEPYVADQIWFRYYGAYSDAHVMFIDNPYLEYPDMLYDIVIGEQTFKYVNGQFLEVYYGGQLYSLEEAYNLGFLTDSDLAKINERYENRLFIYKLSKYTILK